MKSAFGPLSVWWQTNQCVHTTAKITELYEYQIDPIGPSETEPLWSTHIAFQFSANGKDYEGNNFVMRAIYPSRAAAAKELRNYSLSKNISICYMPANPPASWPSDFAIPLRTVTSNSALFLIGALLIALGILIPIRWAKETLNEEY